MVPTEPQVYREIWDAYPYSLQIQTQPSLTLRIDPKIVLSVYFVRIRRTKQTFKRYFSDR
jgi:hypothetical protein